MFLVLKRYELEILQLSTGISPVIVRFGKLRRYHLDTYSTMTEK